MSWCGVQELQGACGPCNVSSLLGLRKRACAPGETLALGEDDQRGALQYATAREKSQILGQTGLRPNACSEKAEEARVS